MALVFYSQKDIVNIDADNVPQKFYDYFQGLSEGAKKRIIDIRPELVEALDYHQGINKSDEMSVEIQEPSIAAPVEETVEESISNIYEHINLSQEQYKSLSPLHIMVIQNDAKRCPAHRCEYKKLQFDYVGKPVMKNGVQVKPKFSCQPYYCAECNRLFFEKAKIEGYEKKFQEFGIDYKFISYEETMNYLRSQMKEIEVPSEATLYIPDVWNSENPSCIVHKEKLVEFPHVLIDQEKKIRFTGYICEKCNKTYLRRAKAVDLQEECIDNDISCPKLEQITEKVKKPAVKVKRIIPDYFLQDGKREAFPYKSIHNDTHVVDEEDIVVVSGSTYCALEGHDTDQVEALFSVREKKDGRKYYLTVFGYCNHCQKYYMEVDDYKRIDQYGRAEFGTIYDIDEDFLIKDGAVFEQEKNHLDNTEKEINQAITVIHSQSDYVSQYEVTSDYDEIDRLNYRKSISRDKYEPRLIELNSYRNVPYKYRVDIVFGKETETYYIGSSDIVIDGVKKVISMSSSFGRELVNVRTLNVWKKGLQYNIKLSREFDISQAYLYGYRNIRTDEDMIFRAGITDRFLLRVLKQRKQQHQLVDIFVTIQENQNAIVDEDFGRNIIVQGCAGSGKTMVLLHRLSALKYKYQEFDFGKAIILTPNQQFNLHINDLADSLQVGSIDRLSVEQYYLEMIRRYSSDFLPTNKVSSEVGVKQAFVDYLYTDEFLEKFAGAYQQVISERHSVLKEMERLYKELNEPFSNIEIQGDYALITEVHRRNTRLMALMQKKEHDIAEAKHQLKKNIEEKDNIEKRLPDAEKRSMEIVTEVLPKAYAKGEKKLADLQQEIDHTAEEIASLLEQKTEVEARLMPFGKKARLAELQEQIDEFEKKRSATEKRLEKAKELCNFSKKEKSDEKIMEWMRDLTSLDKSIQEEIDKCWRTKQDFSVLKHDYADIIGRINQDEENVRKLEEDDLAPQMKDWIRSMNEKCDVLTDYSTFMSVMNAAIKDYVEENKVNVPRGVHRYDLYLALIFCMKYYGKMVGDAKFICFDEGQDIAVNEYKLIRDINGQDVIYNIYGDVNQLLKSGRGISDWNNLKKDFSAKVYTLNENYRNTNQITKYCNQTFEMNVIQTGVDGPAVREISRRELEKDISQIDLSEGKFAILVPRKISKRKYLEMQILPETIRNAIGDKIDNGFISLMYVDEVKGIEFDKVYVVQNKMSKNENYIACTRALSELIIVVDDSIPDGEAVDLEQGE